MALTLFNDAFFQLGLKQKQAEIEDKLLGLSPVVVYLDDEAEALEVMRQYVESLGIEFLGTKLSHEAIAFIRMNKARILLVISDYRMPELNGFEFRQQVLAEADAIPFYILSGYVDRDMALAGVQHRIAGFVNKPCKRENLQELLRTDGDARALQLREDYEMLKSFTEDVVNIVADVEESCLHLENEPQDQETIAKIFGLVHTVKGSSGFFEPRTLHLFAHAFEDVLKSVQSGNQRVNSELISSWLKACDVIKVLNTEFMTGIYAAHNVEELKKILDVDVTQTAASSEAASAAEVRGPAHKDEKPNEVRVGMRVLDEFTQVSGELTVIRNMINKVVGTIEKQHPGDRDVLVLSELLEEMHKINSDMQTKIADIRRVPAQQLIKPLARNLRDTSKALGKQVDFVVEGEDLRLDNAIADTLSRCLVHLMRNAIDHGLELPEERVAAGKSTRGKLVLRFGIENEVVVVSLVDDGRGINTARIREKVISQGLRSAADAERMSEHELHQMIFEAGFSTAAQVTEFSGRGVGMSMVKETVEEQQGKILITSKHGQGSEIRLEIPIPKSVLITNSLFVTSGGESFGIPQEFIIRVLDQHGSGCTEDLNGSRFIRFEGALVPVVSLSQTLGLVSLASESLLVVIDSGGILLALEVAAVHDTEDAVIKPLVLGKLRELGVFKGGTFLGDGTVGLIIDVPGLVQRLGLLLHRQVTAGRAVDVVDAVERQNVISFVTALGVMAVSEEDVFRVEMVSREKLAQTASGTVMPYRGTILSVVALDELLGAKASSEWPAVIPTLIVRFNDHFVGLGVQEILDLMPVQLSLTAPLKPRRGQLGAFLHEGQTFTLLSVEQLCAIAAASTDHSAVEPVHTSDAA